LAAVPEFGRAARIEVPPTPGAEQTRELFERFGGQIYGYCLHQLGSREEAEDAVQTTFMNVFRGLQRGIVPRVEGAWLFKIAHNVCLSRRRSSHRRGRVETPNNFEVLQDIVPARERSADELMRLHDALEGMPETQRRAILLREWRGLSYREIAEELGLSQAAVETLIFRARRALAAGLKEQAEGTSWRRRSKYSIDASGLVAAAKAILFGGGATTAKVAAVAVVATTAIASADLSQSQHHAVRHVRPHARAGASLVVRGPLRPTHAAVGAGLGHAARDHARANAPRTDAPRTAVQNIPARHFVPHERDSLPRVAAEHLPAAASTTAEMPSRHSDAAKEQSAPAAHTAKPAAPRPGHVRRDQQDEQAQQPAPPVEPAPQPTEPSPPVEDTAPQAADEHGPATAPGQQKKADDKQKQSSNGP
jgi:RNA polymerase sigma factor (sigma-70 family)